MKGLTVPATLYGQQGEVGWESGSATSAAAAQSIAETDLGHLEAMVYGLIRALPQTCDAVELASGLSHQTASARIRGLVLRDQLVDSGARARTRSGRFAVVWRVTTAADRAVEQKEEEVP